MANEKTTLGIAFAWMSKKSNLTKTFPIGELKKDSNDEIVVDINENIKPGILRSKIEFKLFVYIKHVNEEDNLFNQDVGTVLGDIWNTKINLEGDGSTFPVEIIQDKNQMLWRAKFNINDIYEDEFDKEFISLQINKEHKDFSALNIEEEELSPMMKEIISQFIFLLMCEVKDMGIDFESFEEYQVDSEEKNIANIIKIWIYLLKIDFSSNYNMMQSIRKGVNEKF